MCCVDVYLVYTFNVGVSSAVVFDKGVSIWVQHVPSGAMCAFPSLSDALPLDSGSHFRRLDQSERM